MALDLGAFSISLSVKDIAASRAFYETLGFAETGGNQAQNWLIMRNGERVIGLFQGMFEGNILTYISMWNQMAQDVEGFTDVRDIQERLKSAGLTLAKEADASTTGPESIMLSDPDGNVILIDQHR